MRCGNPECKAEAIYLRSGSLYYISLHHSMGASRDGEQKRLIWLCSECCKHFVVETWRPAGQQLRHQEEPARRKSVLSSPLPSVAAA
jgi:transposase-like protein